MSCRFANPHVGNDLKSVWDFIRWRLGRFQSSSFFVPKPESFAYPATAKPFCRNRPAAVWIGHSTYLVSCEGFTMLTDPIWNSHCSPIRFAALRRLSQPPFPIVSLPRIDVVLLSHNHYDHLDEGSVRAIAAMQPHVQWLVPKGVGRWFSKRGISACTELDWGQSLAVGGWDIAAVPAQHFSGRSLFDRNKSLWNGYVAKSPQGRKLYFVGDTGYNEYDFKAIGKAFGPMDLSLIPIGSYLPLEFMSPVHVSPFDAVEIHCDVHSRLSLGMHWNTFRLSEERVDQPPYDLYLAMKKKKLAYDTFLPIEIGKWVNW